MSERRRTIEPSSCCCLVALLLVASCLCCLPWAAYENTVTGDTPLFPVIPQMTKRGEESSLQEFHREYRKNVTREWRGLLKEHDAEPWGTPGVPSAEWEARKDAFIAKAVPGGTVRIAAVGGSITAGAGDVGRNGTFVEVLAGLLRLTFPNVTVEVFNGARGATGSATTAFCLREIIGAHADLVLTDFALNDYPWYGDDSDPFELLLRRIAADYPLAPVVNVLYYGVNFDMGPRTGALHDKFAQLSAHYGMGSLSARRLVDRLMELPPGPAGPTSDKSHILADVHHPKAIIHNLVGQLLWLMLIADSTPAKRRRETEQTGRLKRHYRHPHRGKTRSLLSAVLPPPTKEGLLAFDYLHSEDSRPTCHITGMPQVSGVWDINRVIEQPAAWSHLKLGSNENRMDQVVRVMPKKLSKASDGGEPVFGPLVLRLESSHGNLLVLGESQHAPMEYKLLWPRNKTMADLAGQPFRAFYNASGEELPLARVFPGTTELWISAENLAPGEHLIRLEPTPKYQPYVSLASVVL